MNLNATVVMPKTFDNTAPLFGLNVPWNTYQIKGWGDMSFSSLAYNLPLSSLLGFMLLAFSVGCCGLALRSTNLLALVVFGELLLISVMFGFILVATYWGEISGQAYALFILNTIAVESAIGLVLILNIFRVTGSISYQSLKLLRG